jgi:hypothetical protein
MLFYAHQLFFSENHFVHALMWKKYGTARQAIDDNTMWRIKDAISMLDN